MTLPYAKKLPVGTHIFNYVIISRHPELVIFICSLAVSIIACYLMLSRDPNSLLYYGDAVSHLTIARRIIDSLTPGVAQLGSVWLPMTHLMLLPFVINDFLFRTGLAGTIVSGVSTAVTAIFLFRIVKLHFGSSYAGFLASSLFLMNTSVIYMSLIPMMEAPFMMFFIMSSYYALKWYYLNNTGNDLWLQYRTLLKCGVAISAATLTRYEAWFLPLGFILLILIVFLVVKRELWKRKIEAFLFIAGPYSVIGIFAWIVYNAIIFRSPFIFATGPYSAQSQSLTRPYREYLFLQPINAISTIFNVAKDMYGLHVVILSLLGIAAFLYMNRKKSLLFGLLTITVLALPILVDLVAMIEGSGEIYRHAVSGWFNGRYLVFVAPLFAFSCTALAVFIFRKGKKMLTLAALFLILSFYGASMILHPLQLGSTTALSDGTIMHYRGDIPLVMDTSQALKKLYSGGRIIDITLSKTSPLIELFSGIQLKDFVSVNNKFYWETSKNQPWTHVDYVVLQKSIDSTNGKHINETEYFDPIRNSIIYWNKNLDRLKSPWQPMDQGDSLLSSISIVYENPNFRILKNDQKNVVLEKVFDGLNFPSNIAIVDKNDILVAEKKTGQVHLIVNGNMLPQPVLDVDVATHGDRGMLGIAVAKEKKGISPPYVFLYFTEKIEGDGGDIDDNNPYRAPLGNRLYRYELVDDRLVNPKLLLDLPVNPPDSDNGGKVTVGPDGIIYILVGNARNNGDLTQKKIELHNGTNSILRITQDGKSVSDINGNHSPNEKYYVYGITNGSSMDFDPITHNIWYSENANNHDKINVFKADHVSNTTGTTYNNHSDVDFTGTKRYTAPEFMWNKSVGVTAIKFVGSSLGEQYENDMFVGDTKNGNLYDFKLTENRSSLLLNGSLADKVPDDNKKFIPQVFLSDLGGITDIQVGSDGYLYIVTLDKQLSGDIDKFPPHESIYRLKAVD